MLKMDFFIIGCSHSVEDFCLDLGGLFRCTSRCTAHYFQFMSTQYNQLFFRIPNARIKAIIKIKIQAFIARENGVA